MKNNNIYNISILLIVLLISCKKTQGVTDFELDNIVKIEILNKSFRNKNHKRKLEIIDSKIIKNVVQALGYTNITTDKINGSGEGLGFIEIRFTNNKGKEIVFNNSYSVYKGVFLVHYEELDTKFYRNNHFVMTIENLLDTRETIEEIMDRASKVFEEE